MKYKNLFSKLGSSILTLTILLSASILCAQSNPQNTVITLTVDTEGIEEGDVSSYVSLSDNMGGAGPSPAEYITPIDPGMKVEWEAEPLNPESGHKVVITRIKIKGDGSSKTLKNNSYAGNGRVTGYAVDSYNEAIDAYFIQFKVIKGGEQPVDYILDPKLKLNPD